MGTFIRKGTTYVDATVVTPVNLNAHVDDAVIEPTAISALTNKGVLAGTEEVMVNDGGTLKKTALASVYNYIAAVPIGLVSDYAGIVPPDGWFMCFGQAISRTTYSALFTAIGATYGGGDGATTFNLPDCRGRVIAGKDDMGGTSSERLNEGWISPDYYGYNVNGDVLGAAGGDALHQLTGNQMPYHAHTFSDYYQGLIGGGALAGGPHYTLTGGFVANSTAGAGASWHHNNMQPTIIMHKIIKY